MAYRYLWTPLELGPVSTRNRIVFSAHLTNYARDGKPTEQHAAYYGARAAGGAASRMRRAHCSSPSQGGTASSLTSWGSGQGGPPLSHTFGDEGGVRLPPTPTEQHRGQRARNRLP